MSDDGPSSATDRFGEFRGLVSVEVREMGSHVTVFFASEADYQRVLAAAFECIYEVATGGGEDASS